MHCNSRTLRNCRRVNGSPDSLLHRLTRRAWLLVCLTSLCRGDSAPAHKAPAAVTAAPGFVYRAEKRGRVIVLASALHRLRADAYPLPAAYETAYRKSTALWFESDPRDANAGAGSTEAERQGTMSGRKRVEDFLTAPTRDTLREYLVSRNIPAASVHRMRPWYLGMCLRPQGYAANESWRSIVAARNGAWVTKLDALEARHPVMVIVGLDHFIGPEGMIAQLAARGYRVTAVKS